MTVVGIAVATLGGILLLAGAINALIGPPPADPGSTDVPATKTLVTVGPILMIVGVAALIYWQSLLYLCIAIGVAFMLLSVLSKEPGTTGSRDMSGTGFYPFVAGLILIIGSAVTLSIS